jgi:hypothetical protein
MKGFPEVMWAITAVIGGFARHLSLYIRGDKAVFRVSMFLANGFVSGFSGYMFAQVMLNLHPEWVLVAAGIGGYLGAETLEIIINFFKRKFHVK